MTLSRSNILRFVTQWVLPLAAVGVLFLILRSSALEFRIVAKPFVFDPFWEDSSITCANLYGQDQYTSDQKLILSGDRTRSTTVEQQKAIWEKWPTNKVYLHNYITHLASSASCRNSDVTTNGEWRAGFAQEITKLQTLDPENARLDYILAGNLLSEAVKDEYCKTNVAGLATNIWGMKILDRAKLDQAMVNFKIGLGKKEYRRYSSEMVGERLAILGEPTSLLKQISQIGMVAGVLCPDMVICRQLGRTSLAYVGLLIEEGRTNEAQGFLRAYSRFVPQINDDAYTLIDVLVVGAVAGIGAGKIPAAYIQLGDTNAAHKAEVETTALARPVKDWKRKKKELPEDSVVAKESARHSGLLVRLLLPSLGEYPAVADLTPSRMVEYVVAERGALGGLSVALFVVMVFSAVMAFSYHFADRTGGRTAYILLRGREWGRLLLSGVLLPLLGYYIVTRWGPWTSRSLSPAIGYPQVMIQFMALSLVIVVLTYRVTGQYVRQRCMDLGMPVAPEVSVCWRRWMCILVGVLVLLAVLPESWLTDEDLPGHAWINYLPSLVWVALGLSGLTYIGYGIIRRKWFQRTYAAYYGSFARTLVPSIALVMIALNIIALPCLRREERSWIAKDTVMHIDPKGGYIAIETRVSQRLKAEVQQAAVMVSKDRISPEQ